MTRESYDCATVVIGAGAAGLAAAAELVANGHDVAVVEARERLGGRILTLDSPDVAVPIELGAEFIHGESPAIFDWLARSNDAAIDAPQTRWISFGDGLQPAERMFDEMKKVLGRVRPPKNDVSLAEFLDSRTASIPPRIRQIVRMMAEGFDATDAERASARELLEEWSGNASADSPTFRPARGYAALIETLAAFLQSHDVTVKTRVVVQAVEWRRGDVKVQGTRYGEPVELRAERAIVTLPVGVLHLHGEDYGAVRFDPPLLRKERAIEQLGVGPVVKVAMRFKEPFWNEIDGGDARQVAFFHRPDTWFPTFWNTLPRRTSLLVAWAAGPNAMRLIGSTEDELIARVVESLRAVFGRRPYRKELEEFHAHDWQSDDFARGAYSYVCAGGSSARRALAKSVDDTLFFAGEATDAEEAASVGGALQSGKRAAREVLRSR